jgi:unsaturated chondroitin disaccharide hydrolase
MMDRLRKRSWGPLLVAATCVLTAGQALAFDEATADRALQFAREQLERTSSSSGIPPDQYPKNTVGNATWKLVPADNRVDWIQGFYPGLLWFMYEHGRDPVWRERADARTRPIESQKTNTETHDLGFKFVPSYWNAYRLTGDDYYKGVLLTAARSLAERFHRPSGVINCCDWNRRWKVPLVTDTMMNLELLFWAAENGGDPAWKDMALSHALVTLRDMVRPDGGTFHVVDYDDAGKVRSKETFQGYSNPSTWSRGQAWAIYGFTLSYRYTRDPRMLDAAIKTTDYYLDRLPPDSVPFWDMDAPAGQQVKDSSAAAAVASALLELHTYVKDPAVKERYRAAALAMLDSLSSPAYLAMGTQSPAILLHGVAFYRTPIKPKGEAIDESLIYGDYYFVEALLRFKQSLGPAPVPPGAEERPLPPVGPEPRSDQDGQGGCASAAPGPALAAAGLLLWLLRARRQRRSSPST